MSGNAALSLAISRSWTKFRSGLQRWVLEKVVYRRQLDHFYLVFGGHIFFQTLHAAVRFDLFSLLEDEPGLTRSEIASRLRACEQPVRILLLGLCAAGLLRNKRGRYHNERLTSELLTRQSPKNVLAYVHLQGRVMYQGMPFFYDAVKEYRNAGLSPFDGDEPTLYGRLAHHPELEQVFHDAMSALSVQTNQLLAGFVDLSEVSHLVDVGGGDGTNIVTLAKKHPHLRASVFDLPSVCAIASARIAEEGLTGRLGVIEGDCFQDKFPTDADCFLFAHFFTIWSEEKDRSLLKKCYRALPSGGKVIIFNMMQSDDESGPLSAAVGSPYFLTIATGEGMLYTWREYEQWLKDAGFVQVRRQVLPRDHGAIIGVKP